MPRDYTAPHRYRLVTVMRDDAKAIHYTDMGLASKWPYPGFNLIALWEHTAQEMIEDCEAQRTDDWAEQVVGNALAESTLVVDHLRQAEEKRDIIHNRSNFGRYHKVQRNEHRWSATRARTEAAQ